MPLAIKWTRPGQKVPPEVRKALERRLNTLSKHFPEMKRRLTIGITRAYDGLAFQSDDGDVKLMLEVRRKRDGSWQLPTYWTIAHEFMHLAQFNAKWIPGGERSCDIHALARVPPRYIDDSPSYLVVPRGLRGSWTREASVMAHALAKEALARRRKGLRRYAVWWEGEFQRRWNGMDDR